MNADRAPDSRSPVRIDVWCDYVCPFCYLALTSLERIEAEYGEGVQVRWRAFELRPEPEPTLDPASEYLADLWARSVEPMARDRGVVLRLPSVQPRSRLAHEATAYARESGASALMRSRLFRAYFEAGEDIGSREVILRIAGKLNLDTDGLIEALSDGRHRVEVQEDHALAESLGILGVPAMVVRPLGEAFDRALLIEGAQPFEAIDSTVREVFSSAA